MISYKDRTFCVSPYCENECGRKLTEEDKHNANKLGLLISSQYFCGLPGEPKKEENNEE